MLTEREVVGNQEDWAKFITTVDEHETPLLRIIRPGSKPVNVEHQYQADAFDAPQQNSWIDGKDWDTFASAAQNRAELKARVQWFVKTAAVSKLAQDVSNAAGVADELAREIPKKLTEMRRDIEATFGSDNESQADDSSNGNRTRGIGKWLQSTAQTHLPVPTAFLTPSASLYADTKANLNENAVRTVLESMWGQTGIRGTRTAVVGSQLKSRFSDFLLYLPSSVSTQSSSRITNRNTGDRTLEHMVQAYESDFGRLELHLSNWNAHANFGGSATKAQWRGYLLTPSLWELRWNQQPRVYKPEFKGGSYKAAMDAILMLVCKNPLGDGKIAPSDA